MEMSFIVETARQLADVRGLGHVDGDGPLDLSVVVTCIPKGLCQLPLEPVPAKSAVRRSSVGHRPYLTLQIVSADLHAQALWLAVRTADG
jgi:hypothetical protein